MCSSAKYFLKQGPLWVETLFVAKYAISKRNIWIIPELKSCLSAIITFLFSKNILLNFLLLLKHLLSSAEQNQRKIEKEIGMVQGLIQI